MAYSIAANTRLAGSPQGIFLDDLTNPNVGKWPKTQAIRAITNIVVYTGEIIDSVRITYAVENGGVVSPVTVQHGGNSGSPTLTFGVSGNAYFLMSKFLFTPGITLLTADEKILAVYGSRLTGTSLYGDKNITQLSFVVVNSAGGTPQVKVYTATGTFYNPTVNSKFELSWPLTAASSYTFTPPGVNNAFLQAIGFSNALDRADAALL
ncbi:hypothetical protein EDB92DRAFT_1953900 [Lactarius akahatsu]|uniref:Uncharacterized protein n=1 Tax=Lactarius akahatsu TaxID=416441 RepID=A0AAD4L947_9AGAM|nr:hypothetical protein EDB92DRAFT_1953888 [Lactarius akahatsu]KAH8980553.1 hypothetical protein EDB92DRAFT_1953900 [Lactarius akahatsu]